MLKNIWQLGGVLLLTAMLPAGSARADEPVERWPGAVCVPNHPQSAANILYNSAGAIANVSEVEPAWIVCPVRTPYQLTSGQTVVWTGSFQYSASSLRSQCSLRLFTADGGLVASAAGRPSPIVEPAPFPAVSSDFLILNLAVEIGDLGAQKLEASVHCALPPADANERSAGIIAVETQVLD